MVVNGSHQSRRTLRIVCDPADRAVRGTDAELQGRQTASTDVTRIAMWSGPRFLSTALLRSWGSRVDTATADEPFYGYFLAATGAERPGREDSLSLMPHDWETVLRWLEGPVPDGKAIWYQKHHALHLVGDLPWEWMDRVTNCFLIRNPRLVIPSYSRIRPEFSAADLGYEQLFEVFNYVRRNSRVPVVLDASDLRRSPKLYLEALCGAVGVGFDPAMLSWEAGRRSSDPSPCDPWYRKVQQTTDFVGGPDVFPDVSHRYRGILETCSEFYDQLFQHRLRVAE